MSSLSLSPSLLLCMNQVNLYRAIHSVANVTYSSRLAEMAQTWATHMASNDIFMHASSKYGENLAMMGSNVSPSPSLCKTAVDRWYAESKVYDYSNPAFTSNAGHFTQLIWNDTQNIGIGIATSPKTGMMYIAMWYDPPGNVYGRFTLNVFPPKGKEITILATATPPPTPTPTPPIYPPPQPQPRKTLSYDLTLKVPSTSVTSCDNIKDVESCSLQYHGGSGSYYDIVIVSEKILFDFKKYLISTIRNQFTQSDTITLYDKNHKVLLRVTGV